jgi:hypothetical protein
MPVVRPDTLRCVVYLYPSKDAAKSGASEGGSGFIVGVKSEKLPKHYLYAVTNRHMITRGNGNSVVRLRTAEGGVDIFDYSPDQWTHHEDGTDLSIVLLDLGNEKHDVAFIGTEHLITQQIIKDYNIGPGDEVMMISRLSFQSGCARNSPAG